MSLPRGWIETTVGQCSQSIDYGLTCASSAETSSHRYIRITDLQHRQISWPDVPYVDAAESKAALYEVAPRDLLFARTGATVGKSYLVEDVPEPSAFASYLIRVRCHPDLIAPKYAAWFFHSPDYWEQIFEGATGTGQPNFNGSKLANLSIPLPPAAEQRRIVAKLDALTARIARARAELDRVPVLAKRLRERTIRGAFRGLLTADWRQKAYGAKARAGAAGLPYGWTWSSLGELADIKSGLTLGKKRAAEAVLIEVPYLRVANVQRGAVKLDVIKYVPVTQSEIESLRLEKGDMLLNEGGDRDKLGRGWVWEGQIDPCIHQNHVFRARLKNKGNSPYYVSLYTNEFGQDYFLKNGTQTTNLASISKSKISAIPIPVAPVEEQGLMVKSIELAFARADRLEAEAARARKLLDRLESAILAKAFRGELVPQDENDEPAEKLLERIRAERAGAPKAQRGRKSRA